MTDLAKALERLEEIEAKYADFWFKYHPDKYVALVTARCAVRREIREEGKSILIADWDEDTMDWNANPGEIICPKHGRQEAITVRPGKWDCKVCNTPPPVKPDFKQCELGPADDINQPRKCEKCGERDWDGHFDIKTKLDHSQCRTCFATYTLVDDRWQLDDLQLPVAKECEHEWPPGAYPIRDGRQYTACIKCGVEAVQGDNGGWIYDIPQPPEDK